MTNAIGIESKLAAKLGVIQIVGQIVTDEVAARGEEGIATVELSESVVDRGVNWAGGDQSAQFWNRRGEAEFAGDFGGGFQPGRFQVVVDIEGVCVAAVVAGEGGKPGGKDLHGIQRYVIGQAGKSPYVAHRHGCRTLG